MRSFIEMVLVQACKADRCARAQYTKKAIELNGQLDCALMGHSSIGSGCLETSGSRDPEGRVMVSEDVADT
jgi:hypothetical protein